MRNLWDCKFGMFVSHEVKGILITFVSHDVKGILITFIGNIAIIANLTEFVLFPRHVTKYFFQLKNSIFIFIFNHFLILQLQLEYNIVLVSTAWMELESIMLSEISRAVRDKHHMISPLTGT